jgi:hypothetical protein
VKLSPFQQVLLADLVPGRWYDAYQNQGTGGAALPEWFHRQQTQPMQTLRPMNQAGALEMRRVGECLLPQVRRPTTTAGGNHAPTDKP